MTTEEKLQQCEFEIRFYQERIDKAQFSLESAQRMKAHLTALMEPAPVDPLVSAQAEDIAGVGI